MLFETACASLDREAYAGIYIYHASISATNHTLFDLTLFSFLSAIFFSTSPICPERNAPQMRNLPFSIRGVFFYPLTQF